MSKFRDYTKYEVYPDGRIWSYSHKKWLKHMTRKDGYKQVCLSDNEGKSKLYLLHRVVYESITGEPIPDGLQVNHIDENKENNNISNLNLMTPKQNMNWGTCIIRGTKKRINGKLSKAVCAYKDGNLVMTFPSAKEAGRNGFDFGAVAKCCRGKLPHYKGYEWRYI